MSPPGRPALPQAFFLAAGEGQRFCLYHPPAGVRPRGRVLYLHPFAEELNNSRRVIAQQSRALAEAGFSVLQIDLLGCGDSSGDFGDATWDAWLTDAINAKTWLDEHAQGPLWVWGLRAGALLASQLLQHIDEPGRLLLWQPALTGQQVLQQFLRLQSASRWLGGTGGAAAPSPAQALSHGKAVHIAGYELRPALAQGLSQVVLRPPPDTPPAQLVWLEVCSGSPPSYSLSTDLQLERWRQAGWDVHARAVTNPAFWQVASTEDAPNLLSMTLDMLTSVSLSPPVGLPS